ncbi:phosphatidylglycerol lysyltransferase domain-containing protein [Kineococcus rhizosphaerae]|uniref:phosphatidylglycerol lysyltransferase domain-containing protein n=1 Tax=Kineococcus rhizosphaerae TaxID=559628 RepID=UPI00147385F3|nr:phosphatidylglycerol lysyltransferase domain-containing protein [Kineococcus rhizosphaerae]
MRSAEPVRTRTGHEPEPRGGRLPRLLASAGTWVFLLSGLASIAMAVHAPLSDRAQSAPPLVADVVFATSWPSFGYGTVLLLLAHSLAQRKRAAWWTAVVVTGLNAVCNVVWSLVDAFPAHGFLTVQCLLLVLLVVSRREFTVLPSRLGVRQALRIGGGASLVWLAIGTGFVVATQESAGNVLSRLWYAAAGTLVSVDTFVIFPDGVLVPGWVDVVLNSAGTVLVLLVTWFLFRPAADPAALGAAEEPLRRLLATEGEGDALGYFNLRRDKTAVFAPNGRAAVVHRVVGGVSVASGDPVGNETSWPAAVEAWREQLAAHAWRPAVVGASEAGAAVYHRAGLQVLEVGDEAVLDVDAFSLEGRAVRGLRQAVNRARRGGTQVGVRRQQDVPDSELLEIASAAVTWREGQERGFSMALGRLGDPADPDLLVATARTAEGELLAVLTFVPWGVHGVSLDLMRRNPQAPNGTVELVVTDVVAHARSAALQRISLNFAVFRSVFDRGSRLGAGPVLRLWYRVLVVFSRTWQLEQLYRSNAKYQPRWVPRFLCFERTSDLPRIGLAVARVEQFLPSRRG